MKLFQQSLGWHKWLGKGNGSIREWNEPLHYIVVACLFHHVRWGNDTGIITKVHRCPQHMLRWFLGHHRKLLDVHHNKLHTANLAKFLRDLDRTWDFHPPKFLPFELQAESFQVAGHLPSLRCLCSSVFDGRWGDAQLDGFLLDVSLTATDSLVGGIFQKWPTNLQ